LVKMGLGRLREADQQAQGGVGEVRPVQGRSGGEKK
jgi:hypothetical protein